MDFEGLQLDVVTQLKESAVQFGRVVMVKTLLICVASIFGAAKQKDTLIWRQAGGSVGKAGQSSGRSKPDSGFDFGTNDR